VQAVNKTLLDAMTQRLVDQFQPEQVILFGSHVWGTPEPGSDVDLLVIVTESDMSEYERAVQGHRCLSGLDVAKDVIVKTRAEFEFFRQVTASLEHKIAERGKILYERSQETVSSKLAHESAA